ncbi:MAG: hypothetical protein H6Q00_1857 [Holophagaceae bacterium]|nr:hypothetical protein [Holophagaceae bacterium]
MDTITKKAWSMYRMRVSLVAELPDDATLYWPPCEEHDFGVILAGSEAAAERMLEEIVAGRVEMAG